MITLHEKIEVIEAMIRDTEFGQAQLPCDVLKAIARDLRARLDGAPSVAETELGRRINAVEASKAQQAGNLNQRLSALGQEVIARWPVISQALARFADEREGYDSGAERIAKAIATERMRCAKIAEEYTDARPGDVFEVMSGDFQQEIASAIRGEPTWRRP